MNHPPARRLRIFAFDPSLASRLETAVINEIAVEIQWETNLREGPIGEYVEVVDCDPASGYFYPPVALNATHLVAQDGLPPSESNPQFHQQMVYAVAMTTIRQFERALGRVALWADRRTKDANGKYVEQFVRRLRIYPHALRDRNAYYSPTKKALLFGYFTVTAKDADNTPGTLVFTCLSHDIVAHEVTHALLDGVHPRFNEPTNPDVHAFHEAFADIVALFQHFSYPSVLESQIRRTRGDLRDESLLGQLAQQFGRATGRGGALRDALGQQNEATGRWEPRSPNPRALDSTPSPHARGAILVAAVFRAFLLMYRSRTADLFRIATQGTGTLPDGDIHPDLARRLALEAAACAERILQMCIRAIDYCPPVDITFGDFLRGVVTADVEFSPADKTGYRIVFIESFREWGIHPRRTASMGLDALVWPSGDDAAADAVDVESATEDAPSDEEKKDRKTRLHNFVREAMQNWNLESDRYQVWKDLERVRWSVWRWLTGGDSMGQDYAKILGLVLDWKAAPTIYRSRDKSDRRPTLEIHSARPALRRTADGSVRTDLVVEATQRRRGYFDARKQEEMDALPADYDFGNDDGDFTYRAGCTILIDPRSAEIRRVIRTAGDIADDAQLDRVRRYLTGESDVQGMAGTSGNAFDAGLQPSLRLSARLRDEPFALLHQSEK